MGLDLPQQRLVRVGRLDAFRALHTEEIVSATPRPRICIRGGYQLAVLTNRVSAYHMSLVLRTPYIKRNVKQEVSSSESFKASPGAADFRVNAIHSRVCGLNTCDHWSN